LIDIDSALADSFETALSPLESRLPVNLWYLLTTGELDSEDGSVWLEFLVTASDLFLEFLDLRFCCVDNFGGPRAAPFSSESLEQSLVHMEPMGIFL
jgi:hypothetical protein